MERLYTGCYSQEGGPGSLLTVSSEALAVPAVLLFPTETHQTLRNAMHIHVYMYVYTYIACNMHSDSNTLQHVIIHVCTCTLEVCSSAA